MTSFCVEHFPDDPAIENSTELLRRIPPWDFILDENIGRVCPSSGTFEDDDNDAPMSVCLLNLLLAQGRDAESMLAGHRGFALASIMAGLVPSHNQTVHPDPLPEETAHALVCGLKKGSVRRSFARNAKWIVFPPVPA